MKWNHYFSLYFFFVSVFRCWTSNYKHSSFGITKSVYIRSQFCFSHKPGLLFLSTTFFMDSLVCFFYMYMVTRAVIRINTIWLFFILHDVRVSLTATRWVSLVKLELLTLLVKLNSPRYFVRFVWLNLTFALWCFADLCLSVFFWLLHCFFFDLRLLITPLVSLSSSIN